MKSKIKIKGKYKFTIKFNVPLYGTINLNCSPQNNQITNEGKEFILRRLYNNIPDPINYITISKTQDLENLKKDGTVNKISKTSSNPEGVEFTASFTNTQMENIEQISLTNKEKDGVIITHSTLNTPFSKLPDTVTVDVNYTLTMGENKP